MDGCFNFDFWFSQTIISMHRNSPVWALSAIVRRPVADVCFFGEGCCTGMARHSPRQEPPVQKRLGRGRITALITAAALADGMAGLKNGCSGSAPACWNQAPFICSISIFKTSSAFSEVIRYCTLSATYTSLPSMVLIFKLSVPVISSVWRVFSNT